jgi:hypothetical protein
MLKLFNESTVAKKTRVFPIEHSKILAFMKFSSTNRMLVFVNTTNSQSSIQLPDSLVNTTWINGMAGSTYDVSDQVELDAYGYLLLHQTAE